MSLTGIICEYNPLHLGHWKQLELIKRADPEGAVVCLMSGNYVQRGKPAVFHKLLRAEAAVRCGADLVLELPVTAALSSAEGFAAEGVRILGNFCHRLCFGAETADKASLLSVAQALLSKSFSEQLQEHLSAGLSFPAARQAALEAMGMDGAILTSPNNILAVEYCKAVLAQNSTMDIFPIQRLGDYHDTVPDKENPSATAVRTLMEEGDSWEEFLPAEAAECFRGASVHSLSAGERAILARLRTMTDGEFEALPFGSEGLWRKLMHEARRQRDLESILTAVKSKRYTRSRLDRMVMCAFLGLTQRDLSSPAPYVRLLALNEKGRSILKTARQAQPILNMGEKTEDPYQVIEDRCQALYGLFCQESPEAPLGEEALRVRYVE